MSARHITKAAFAKEQQVSRQAVSKWVSLGLPVTLDGQIERARAKKWLAENISRPDSGKSGSESLTDARARKESALADLRQIECAVKRGQFVSIEDTEKMWSELVMTFRARMLGIPSKLAVFLASENEASACFALLEREIHAALTELSGHKPPEELAEGK